MLYLHGFQLCFSICHQEGLKLKGTHQFLIYTDDVDRVKTDTIKKNVEVLLEARREVGQEVNIETTKYTFISCHQNAGQIIVY
jgi:hypothetical protein